MIKPLRKGVGYLRISDNKQIDNHSIELQKAQIKLLAEKENIDIIHWREDIAKSAYRIKASKRPGLKQVIADVDNGIEVVCFYEESRITRSITDFYNEIYLPIKTKNPMTAFYSTQFEGEWDPNNPLVQAKLVFAAEESEVKSTRAKDTQTTLLTKTIPVRPGSRAPLGFEMVEGILYPNDEAKIVELIFDLAKWGHSDQDIAGFLNAAEIKTKNISTWNASTVGYILNNPVYQGHLRWNARINNEILGNNSDGKYKLYPNTHSRIVSETTSKLVFQTKELKKQYGMLKTPFLFKDLLVCGNCGNKLSTKNNNPKVRKKDYLTYKCDTCKKNFDAEQVHEYVFNDLLKKWISQLDSLSKKSKKLLLKWKKTLKSSKESIQSMMDKTLLNERELHHEITANMDLSRSFAFTKNYLQSELEYFNNAINEIETLLDEEHIFQFLNGLKNANFSDLLNVEKRTLSLLMFNQIVINHETDPVSISIEYGISPFHHFEDTIGQNIEEIKQFKL